MIRKAPRKSATPPKKPAGRVVKCRRCKWAVVLEASHTDKKGSGWRQLWEHVNEKHTKYIKEVKKWSRWA